MRPIILAILLISVPMAFGAAGSAQPSLQFASLETRLLEAEALSFDFQLSASGALEVSIDGTLLKSATGDFELTAAGLFAGQNVDVIVLSRENAFSFGSRSEPNSAPAPTELWQALMIGFTRMGILHNIANLTAGAMPDHAAGGVADWVQTSNITAAERAFSFDITVSNEPSGSATLHVDEMANPLRRNQTVAFPGGEMIVVETYSNFKMSE